MTDRLSPFAEAGPALLAAGYSPIPIHPEGKMPGAYGGGKWYIMRAWNRYCSEFPDPFSMKNWSRWPNANVGVALGRGVIGFDIDREDMVDKIKAVLPPAIVGKRGKKGETLFYRADTDAIRSRGFKIDGFGVMDLIADGKQTVLPPSNHPDIHAPYVWTTERTLLDTRPEELSFCTAEHFEAVLEVLSDHGWHEEKKFDIIPGERGTADSDKADVTEFYRKLNDDALANLDAWVPRLGLTRLEVRGDGYRSVAEWRPSNSGKAIGKRNLLLSINAKGIVDYGDGEKGYTPINLVMAAHEMADFQRDKAVVWLGELIGYRWGQKMLLNRKPKPPGHVKPPRPGTEPVEPRASAPAAPVETVRPDPYASDFPGDWPAPLRFPGDEEARTPNVVSIPVKFDGSPEFEPAEEFVNPSDDDIEELTQVPGLVGDIVKFILDTSESPCRPLAFAAAISLVGAIAGRNYATETDLRTNVYAIGVGPSSCGKGHARKCIKKIIQEGVLSDWLGGESIASGSALRKRIEAHPSTIYAIDEIGGFMRKISDERNLHTREIRTMLLAYYSAANEVYCGTDYAGERATPVHNPNVCIYGVSTPTDFWESFRSTSIKDGFLPRVLVFSVGKELIPEVRPKLKLRDLPRTLIDRVRVLADPKVGGNLHARTADGTTSTTPLYVPFARGVEDMWREDRARYRVLGHNADDLTESFYGKLCENAMKIALILAIGVDAFKPVITAALWQRSVKIARHCVDSVLNEINGNVADNDRQREHLNVRRWIEDAGPSGITLKGLSRMVKGNFDDKRLNDILKSLSETSKEIGTILYQNPKGGPKSNRFVAEKYLDQAIAS